MSGELPKEFMSQGKRRETDLKTRLAAKLKLSLNEQIAMGLVEPVNVERMTRHVGKRKEPPRGKS